MIQEYFLVYTYRILLYVKIIKLDKLQRINYYDFSYKLFKKYITLLQNVFICLTINTVSQNNEYCKGFDHVSLQRLIYLIFHYNTAVFRDKEYVASMNYSSPSLNNKILQK